jgi:osmotically-inducible protein OsmY
MTRSEEQIKRAVIDRISSDSGVDSSNIGVYVHEGRVVLRGTVPNGPASDSAKADALRVAGVTEVDNQLEVRLPPEPPPTDEQLKSQIQDALSQSPSTHGSQLHVTVDKGVATITGSVDTLWLKTQVERIAGEVGGVSGVRNHAKVVPPETVPDSVIAKTILGALERSELIDDETVEVGVEEGVVTLSGSVASHSASRTAHNFALNTGGVKDLRNNLTVRSS